VSGTAIAISYIETDNVQTQQEMPTLDIPKIEQILRNHINIISEDSSFFAIWTIRHWVSSPKNFEGLQCFILFYCLTLKIKTL
jgi:hypothetical protein